MKRESIQGTPLFVSAAMLLALLLAVVVSIFILLDDRARIFQTANQKLENHIWLVTEGTERLMESIDSTFLRLSSELAEEGPADLSEAELRKVVNQATAYMPELANCLVLDAQGTVRYVLHPGRAAGIAKQYRHYFEDHRDKWEQVIISSQPPEGNELGYLYFSRRLQSRKGDFRGMLLAVVAPASFMDASHQYDPQDIDAVLLLDTNNRVLTSWPRSQLFSAEASGNGVLNWLASGMKRVKGAPGESETLETESSYVQVHNLARYPLRIVAAYDMQKLFGKWIVRRNWLFGALGMCGVLGVWISLVLYNQRQLLASAQGALIRREQDYRTLAENFPAGIIMLFDKTGRIAIAEGQGLEVARLCKSSMEGNFPDAFFPADVASMFSTHHGFVLDGKHTTFTVSLYDRVYHAHSLPLLNSQGVVESGMTVVTDVTRREESEAALRGAKEAAETASLLKGQFVANISHELRTPISGIMGITEVALSEGPPPKWRRHFHIIKNVSDGLLGVINDVLDFSRIEAGKMVLEHRPYNLGDLIADILEAMRLRATQKGVDLNLDVGPGIEFWLVGDPGRLRQVLVNLVENAIKFTESGGGVTIELKRVGTVSERQGIMFSVSDTGIGIASDRIGDLFDSFSQVDGTLARQHGGSGLGLAICRHLVEIMGGNIRVESQPGVGSRFYFTLTLSVHDRAVEVKVLEKKGMPYNDLGQLNILLAEDNELNQEFLTYFLEDYGHVVIPARNGEEALQQVREGKPDLVLMDVQMPVLSGLEATRRIREAQEPYNAIPIVALTAHAMAGDRERFLKQGMDAFVGKPVSKDQLFDALQQAWDIAAARGWSGRDNNNFH